MMGYIPSIVACPFFFCHFFALHNFCTCKRTLFVCLMVTGCSVSLTSCGVQRWLRSVCPDCSFSFPSFTVTTARSLLLFWTSFSLCRRRRKKEITRQYKQDVPPLSHLFPIFLLASFSFSQKLQLFL